MTISSAPTSTCLLQQPSSSGRWLTATAPMSPRAGSLDCWSFSASYKKSGGLRKPPSGFLVRKQWVVQHQGTGQYLRAIDGRQVVWTGNPALAHQWLTTEAIVAMLQSDPELFGDLTQLRAVELSFTADPLRPTAWSFHG